MAEPLTREERTRYISLLPQTLRTDDSWQMRYEATVQAAEERAEALRAVLEEVRNRARQFAGTVYLAAACDAALEADDKMREG